jgi:hypothetical protein
MTFSAGTRNKGGTSVRTHAFIRTSPFHICKVEGVFYLSTGQVTGGLGSIGWNSFKRVFV